MIRTSILLAAFTALALASLGCHSKTTAASRSTDYSVVSEGSANGVTSTLNAPGETAPPLTASNPTMTGTNADTTTDFTIADTALQQLPANVGTNGAAGVPPAGTYAPQSSPAYRPTAPRSPSSTSTTGTIIMNRHPEAQQPRPAPPEPPQAAPPTDTDATGTTAPTDTTSTQPQPAKKKSPKPPEQQPPTNTDTTDTGVPTETGTIGHQ